MAETAATRATTLFVNWIHAEINERHRQRFQLLTKLNTLRSATRHLPHKILVEIFWLSVNRSSIREPETSYVDLSSIFKIGSVCKQWRRAAWSASNLWTTCLLTPPPSRTLPDEVKCYVTSLALDNCQACNRISVHVDLNNVHRGQLEVLFNQHRTCLRALRVNLRDPYGVEMWNLMGWYFGGMSSDLSNLKELWVCWPKNVGISAPAFHTSSPGTGEVQQYVREKWECVPWRAPLDQLTVIRLANIPVDQCVKLLLHSSSLVDFHCVDPIRSSEQYNSNNLLPESKRPTSLHNIKQFRWRASHKDWNLFLFSSIRLPNLERLFLDSAEFANVIHVERALYEIFIPSADHIRTLDFESTPDTERYFSWIRRSTSLSTLERLYIITQSRHGFMAWFKQLTLPDGKNPRAENILPKLRILHVDIRGVDVSDEQVFNAICDFLASRRRLNGSHTRLERLVIETTRETLGLEQEQKEELSKFVTGGLIVEVLLQVSEEEDMWSKRLE